MAIGIGIGLTFGRRKGIDAQAQAAFNSLQSAGFTTPQGITGINAAFKTIKTIYGTSDITTAISFFGDPSLAYQIGAGSGTTLGQAIRTLPNIIDPTRATDAVQTTAASQPLLLVHSGENYWQGVGVAGNFVRTPNAAANQITGNIEITAQINPLVLNIDQNIVNKSGVSGVTMGYNFFLNSAGGLNFSFSPTGSVATRTTVSSTVSLSSVGLSANTIFWVRITRNATSGDIQFFTSTNGTTFSQLGATINALIGNLFNSTEQLNIGTWGDVLHYFTGKIYRATISNSIGGAPVVDFNPNQYNPSTSQTQWTSSTGEVWSINTGTATTGYKGVLVDRTIMQGDGVDDRLSATALANKTVLTKYVAEKFSGNAQYLCSNSSNAMLIYTNGSGVIRASSATEVVFNNATRFTRTDLLTAVFDTSGITLVNNANQLTGNLSSAGTGTGLFLFSGSSGSFMCATINTYIESIGANNSTQRTAMYNYIRSINNNAF